MAIAHDKSSRPKCNPSISIVPHTVWTDQELNATDLRVLLAISSHCRTTDREAWPSQSSIAEQLSLARESVSRSVARLEKRGHLRVQRVFGLRGEQRSNRYFVPLDIGVHGDLPEFTPVTVSSPPPWLDDHTPLDEFVTPPVTPAITHNRERLTENVEQETFSLTPKVPKDSKPKMIAGKFEEFWSIYPKKQSRGQAESAYAKAIKQTDHDQIISGLQRSIQSDHRFQNKQYTPMASTWLNAKGYLDSFSGNEPTAAKPTQADLLRAARTYIRQMDVYGDKFWDHRWTEHSGLTEAQARLLVSQAEQEQTPSAPPNLNFGAH